MKTDVPDSKGSGHAPPHATPAPSPLRLAILVSVLVVVVGALLYDWVIAPPRVKAANDKLLDEVRLYNETGLKPGAKKGDLPVAGMDGMLYSDDIQKILGMAPTTVESTELYTIEHYRWWGWIPRNRNYITVLYIGDPKKPHYSTHYANMMPEDGVVPGKRRSETTVESPSETNNATVATPGGAPGAGRPAMAPPMMGPGMGAGMGPPGGGGKGKGRPQGTADKKGSEPKGADEEAKKTEEPIKNAPAKTEEPQKETAGEGEKKEPAKEGAKEPKLP
jgi:hypothetical protein